jgi:hypothetical protein
MMAMKMINLAHVRKGRIRSFTSYCGGLPSPEAANNPLAYKVRYLLELLGFKTFIFYGFLETFQTEKHLFIYLFIILLLFLCGEKQGEGDKTTVRNTREIFENYSGKLCYTNNIMQLSTLCQ